jgi:CBS-domain-containing membrane protein
MNIQAFLKPFHEIIYVYDDHPLGEALKIMTEHRFQTIPIITRDQKYVGTLAEGDFLHFILEKDNFHEIEKLNEFVVNDVKRHRDYEPLNIDSLMATLLAKAADENFVPIIDQNDIFIGIITRKTLLNYFFEHNFLVL